MTTGPGLRPRHRSCLDADGNSTTMTHRPIDINRADSTRETIMAKRTTKKNAPSTSPKRKTANHNTKDTSDRKSGDKSAGKSGGGGNTEAKAKRIYAQLMKMYPDARCALDHRDAFELLVATILSAQCTDERVNKVTPDLFKKYPDAKALAQAPIGDIEEAVRSTGFYRNKAKSIQGASQLLVEHHQGRVPDDMAALTSLPGVARKTANVVLGNVFGKNDGVVVDTHVARLSQRIGFTSHKDPKKIEQDLMRLFPRESWTMLAHLLIHHGRAVCSARKPKCDQCGIAKDCPKVGVKA